MGFLGTIFSGVIGLLVFLAAIIGFFSLSSLRAEEHFDACQARLLEHVVKHDNQTQFLDLCMSGAGYKKSGCDPVFYPVASCYLPRWVFWA